MEMSGRIIKVMLVDDHAVVRAGYRLLLDQVADIAVVSELQSGEDANACYLEVRPDVVVMDISMPGMGGLEAIRRIRAKDKHARILVFSMHENTAFVQHALDAGASGYITKNSAATVLVEAVREVMAGKTYLDEAIASSLSLHQAAHRDSPFADLSKREFDIFRRFAEGASANEIANDLSLSIKTVANYQTQIKEKLGINSTAELVRLAITHGVTKM